MKRLLFGALCAAALAVGAAPSEASCIATLKWHGHQYRGGGKAEGVPRGAKLAESAKIPGCNDVITNGKPANEPTTEHVARRVKDVPPALALLVRGRAWFNAASFPSLASHPLHDPRYGETRPDRPTKPCTITGTALPEPAGFRVEYGRKRTLWVTTTPDADVQLQRYGTGFIPRGTRITVHGSCEPSTYFTTVVAYRVTAAPDSAAR